MQPVTVKEDVLAIIFILTFASFVGVVIRIVLINIESYAGSTTLTVAYNNFFGCMIVGIILEHRMRITSKAHLLYQSLSVGLCGSITSFSGIIIVSTTEYFNLNNFSRDRFNDL